MFLVGLTGGIASGKSTVAKIFRDEYGCPIIDADKIARQVVEPGKPSYFRIKQIFGDSVFFENGDLNREKLGQIIFNDESKRRQLNSIVHPAIKKEMLQQIFRVMLSGHQFAILDIPLLFETKQLLSFVSFSIVVFCSEEQQLTRLMQRNNLEEAAAKARISSQMPLKDKCNLCTFVIDNTQTQEVTENNVHKVHQRLKASKRHMIFRLSLFSVVMSISYGAFYLCRFLGSLW